MTIDGIGKLVSGRQVKFLSISFIFLLLLKSDFGKIKYCVMFDMLGPVSSLNLKGKIAKQKEMYYLHKI